jgi:hypothetical protein
MFGPDGKPVGGGVTGGVVTGGRVTGGRVTGGVVTGGVVTGGVVTGGVGVESGVEEVGVAATLFDEVDVCTPAPHPTNASRQDAMATGRNNSIFSSR